MGMGQDMMADWYADQAYNDGLEDQASRWAVKANEENMIAVELGKMGFHRAQTDALARRNACAAIAKKILAGV